MQLKFNILACLLPARAWLLVYALQLFCSNTSWKPKSRGARKQPNELLII